ncbi:MAG: cation-translocating P-type ATPase [Candidatus Methanomethylophilaceae archaeon]|nr:cation-translocating P-type ATPase [Candidatus Methanomethylophilaceae archaeon]
MRDSLGLDDLVWECTPEAKMRTVEHFESEGPACMVGDGINDAPALRRASVGISMGSIGNDLAVTSSDVVFLNDDVGKLPGLLRLSRRSVKTIAAGLAMSMCVNIAGTALAMGGLIGPAAGALIHNGGSLAVVLLTASLLWSPDLTRSPNHIYPDPE